MSTSSAAAVVPPGEVTFCRKRRGVEIGAVQQFAGAGDGLTREPAGEVGRQAGSDAGLGHGLRKQEHVGRPGAGHGGDGVDQAFVVDPFDLADGGEQARGELALICADLGVGGGDGDAAPIAAGVFGMARTIAVSAGRRSARKRMRASGHDRDDQRALADMVASGGTASGAVCGLTAMTMAAAVARLPFGLILSPRFASALIGLRRLRLEHDELARV